MLNFDLIVELIKSDLKTKYKNSLLGFFWIIFEPLFLMIIIYIVFNRFMRFNMRNYPLFILSGTTLWRFFVNTTTQSLQLFNRYRELVLKVKIERLILPLSLVISNLIIVFFEYIIYIIFYTIINKSFPLIFLFFIPYLIVFSFFLFGLSTILSVIYVFFRDVKAGWEILVQALFFLCPIFYPFELVPYNFIHLYLLNPVSVYVIGIQNILFYSNIPDITVTINSIFFSIIFTLFGYLIFNIYEDRMVKSL